MVLTAAQLSALRAACRAWALGALGRECAEIEIDAILSPAGADAIVSIELADDGSAVAIVQESGTITRVEIQGT